MSHVHARATITLLLFAACSIDTPIATSSDAARDAASEAHDAAPEARDAAPDSPVCLEVCDVWEHLPETFTGCRGDVNGDGHVDVADNDAVEAHFASYDPVAMCLYDVTGDGQVTGGDSSVLRPMYDTCRPLPSFQNGSGLAEDGEPDTRFGGCAE